MKPLVFKESFVFVMNLSLNPCFQFLHYKRHETDLNLFFGEAIQLKLQ